MGYPGKEGAGEGLDHRDHLRKDHGARETLSLSAVPINPQPARRGNPYSVYRRLPLC